MVKLSSSLETKMILKIPNETFFKNQPIFPCSCCTDLYLIFRSFVIPDAELEGSPDTTRSEKTTTDADVTRISGAGADAGGAAVVVGAASADEASLNKATTVTVGGGAKDAAAGAKTGLPAKKVLKKVAARKKNEGRNDEDEKMDDGKKGAKMKVQ